MAVERKRVRVDVDPVLWAQLRLRAVKNQRTVSDELHEILEQDLRSENWARIRAGKAGA